MLRVKAIPGECRGKKAYRVNVVGKRHIRGVLVLVAISGVCWASKPYRVSVVGKIHIVFLL